MDIVLHFWPGPGGVGSHFIPPRSQNGMKGKGVFICILLFYAEKMGDSNAGTVKGDSLEESSQYFESIAQARIFTRNEQLVATILPQMNAFRLEGTFVDVLLMAADGSTCPVCFILASIFFYFFEISILLKLFAISSFLFDYFDILFDIILL